MQMRFTDAGIDAIPPIGKVTFEPGESLDGVLHVGKAEHRLVFQPNSTSFVWLLASRKPVVTTKRKKKEAVRVWEVTTDAAAIIDDVDRRPAQVVYTDPRYAGLLLKVGAAGTKTWAYRSTTRTEAGRRPWKKIGRYPKISYKEALEKYRQLDGGTEEKDLHAQIRELEAELRALKRRANFLSFEQLVDEYHRRRLLKLRNPREHLRILLRDPVRVWGRRPAEEISRDDVLALLDEVVERGAPVGANRVLVKTKAVFNWGIKNGLVRQNPATGIENPTVEVERERCLSNREIRLYWFELHRRQDIRPEVVNALSLCLLTGQRRVEVAGMRWDELSTDDEGRMWWSIPAIRTKATRSTRVYLSPLACALVHRQREVPRVSKTYVFPRVTSLKSPLREDDLSESMKLVTDDLIERRLIGERATPHDLRRTFGTGVAENGFADRFKIQLLLNHGSRSVTDRYDRYPYDAELAAAWGKWSRYLSGKILALGPPQSSR